jgi:ABC-type nitrate/sulfonate/bicarbonate transport system permease component
VVTPTWPSVSTVLLTFWQSIVDGTYLKEFGSSLERLAIGYLIATVCAIAIGVAMGVWRGMYMLFEPLVELLRPIPSPAYLPIAILFLGIDNAMKVFMVAFASFFPILLNTVAGCAASISAVGHRSRVQLNRAQIIWRIVLPAAASFILTGMRISPRSH